jgi:tetratricopeptide (TPR) repeat protein
VAFHDVLIVAPNPVGGGEHRAYREVMSWLRTNLLMLAVVPLIMLFGTIARADQTDPQLDHLFGRLQKAVNPVEAQAIEQAIWSLWIKAADPVLNLEMLAGVQALNKGELKEALRIFDLITERAPEYAEGWNKRATVLFFLSEFDRSMTDIARTLDLEPRHFGALSGMGMIYVRLGDLEAAAEAMERALEMNPHLPGVREQIDSLRRQHREKAI